MNYLVTAEFVPSGIGEKCLKRLSLFFLCTATESQGLSLAVADKGGDPALRSIGEETHRAGTVGSFASLPGRCCARCGYQFPRAHKFIVCAPAQAIWQADRFSHRYNVLIVILF